MIDQEFIWQQLKTVQDPDVFVNVVDLGLIYSIEENEKNLTIVISMTLTSPSCSMSDFLINSVKKCVESIYPQYITEVNLIWDPPWNSNMITESGKMELGLL